MNLWRYGHAIEMLGQRYRLQQPLGSGGMADVCLAWDEQEALFVAIKVIKSDNLDQKSLDRFLKEIAQIMRLDHPHILHVYSSLNLELLDVAHGSIVPYIVMEYAQGGDLQRRLRTGVPYDFDETLHIFAQMASAVQYAHEQGVIHRDIKPHNILFRRAPGGTEQAVLSDFGLAVEITATHHTFASGGTLAYMAPEQLRGQAQAASDIFSLGVVLYQLCTGNLPFQRSLADLARLDSPEPPPPASSLNSRVPPALDDVLSFALASDPAQRPASAALLLELVQDAARSAPPVSHLSDLGHGHPSTLSGWNAPRSGRTAPMHTSSFAEDAPARSPAFTRDLNAATDPVLGNAAMPMHTSQRSLTRSDQHIIQLPSGTSDVSRLPTARSAGTTPSRPATPARRSLTSAHSAHLSTPLTPLTPSTPPMLPIARPPVTPVPRGPRRNTKRGGLTLRLDKRTLPLLILAIVAVIAIPTAIFIGHNPPASATTTVTITPASHTISYTYTVTAVTQNPAANQLQARSLTASAQSAPQTVNATGQAQTAAKLATGKLTFSNGSFTPYTISNNTAIIGNSGISVYLDTPLTINAADANTGTFGTATATAHAAVAGLSGNIGALDINRYCCASAQYIYVKNVAAFAGGVDPQSYTVVAQGDIAAAGNTLAVGATSAARGQVRGMVRAGESVAGDATCTPQVQANHQAGDRATTVTVQVTVTCVALTYEGSQIAPLLTPRLVQQMQNLIGADLASSAVVDSQGKRTDMITLLSVTVAGVDTTAGTITLQVNASGTWVYQFSATQLNNMKGLVAGKSVAQAKTILAALAGVASVAIRPDTGTLPDDAGQFGMTVQVVRGAMGGNG